MPRLTPAEIRAIRTAHGLTIAELGQRCGVSRKAAESWTLPEASRSHRYPSLAASMHLERLRLMVTN
jgi:transcriptional regulator with XRE-family HTH domain